MILGIDEVGRGPWAGPLVVGAVVLSQPIEGLTDSKKLSAKRRTELDKQIRESAAIGLGWVHADELDTVGLSESLKQATIRAVEQIKVPYHEIIIDGTVNLLKDTGKGKYVTTLKKADLLISAVSAASIVAKVARDAYMIEQDTLYPEYGFKNHVGYGTAAHRKAIEEHGVTPLHRMSFAGLDKYDRWIDTVHTQNGFAPSLTGAPASGQSRAADVLEHESVLPSSTKFIGDEAEGVAADYLKKHGHKILERNWKTTQCEIDIVSIKQDTIYFTEVKYRKKADQGGGLAAITKTKLRQMQFAAKYYATVNKYQDKNLCLSAISLGGTPPEVEEYLERL